MNYKNKQMGNNSNTDKVETEKRTYHFPPQDGKEAKNIEATSTEEAEKKYHTTK